MKDSVSIEPAISKVAYDELIEKPSYSKRRAEFKIGDNVVTRMELDDDGRLLINGKYSDTPPVLPKKVDKVILY